MGIALNDEELELAKAGSWAAAIKAVRARTGAGLKEAKDVVIFSITPHACHFGDHKLGKDAEYKDGYSCSGCGATYIRRA